MLFGDQVKQCDPARPNVTSFAVNSFLLRRVHHFRRHEEVSSLRRIGDQIIGAIEELADTKVTELDFVLLVNKYVLGLQITM